MKEDKIFEGMVMEEELKELADMNDNGGIAWEVIGSITAIITVASNAACPSVPCTSTGYCK